METPSLEMNRPWRSRVPFRIALHDVDNFKQLDDKLRYQAGDNALVHLVTVIKTRMVSYENSN